MATGGRREMDNRVNRLAPRLVQWLDEALPTLTEAGFIDVHINTLYRKRVTPQQQLDASPLLFSWMLSHLGSQLADRIVALVIPLRDSRRLDPRVPRWESLTQQLSRTPPSFYVIEVNEFLLRTEWEGYSAPIPLPMALGERVYAEYQCMRLLTDPEEGWSRRIRIVSTAFVRRGSSNSDGGV